MWSQRWRQRFASLLLFVVQLFAQTQGAPATDVALVNCANTLCPDNAKCGVFKDAAGIEYSVCARCDGTGRDRVAGNACSAVTPPPPSTDVTLVNCANTLCPDNAKCGVFKDAAGIEYSVCARCDGTGRDRVAGNACSAVTPPPPSADVALVNCANTLCPDKAKCGVFKDAAGIEYSVCGTCDGTGRNRVAGHACSAVTEGSTGGSSAVSTGVSQPPADVEIAGCYNPGCPDKAPSILKCRVFKDAAGVDYSECLKCDGSGRERVQGNACKTDTAADMTPTAPADMKPTAPDVEVEIAICYNPACPTKSKCRALQSAEGAQFSVCGICDGSGRERVDGNTCNTVTVTPTASEATTVSKSGDSSPQASKPPDVTYCVWTEQCTTGNGRCGVMDLGAQAGGVFTMCACSDGIRQSSPGNLCAEQRASAGRGRDVTLLVLEPAVRLQTLFANLTLSKFSEVEGDFRASVAKAAGVAPQQVMVMSARVITSRRRERQERRERRERRGLEVVTEIETRTPTQVKSSVETKLLQELQASGLPTVSEMQMDSVGPPDTSSSPTTPAAVNPSRTATAGAAGASSSSATSMPAPASSSSLPNLVAVAAGAGAGAGVLLLGLFVFVCWRVRAKASAGGPPGPAPCAVSNVQAKGIDVEAVLDENVHVTV